MLLLDKIRFIEKMSNAQDKLLAKLLYKYDAEFNFVLVPVKFIT